MYSGEKTVDIDKGRLSFMYVVLLVALDGVAHFAIRGPGPLHLVVLP